MATSKVIATPSLPDWFEPDPEPVSAAEPPLPDWFEPEPPPIPGMEKLGGLPSAGAAPEKPAWWMAQRAAAPKVPAAAPPKAPAASPKPPPEIAALDKQVQQLAAVPPPQPEPPEVPVPPEVAANDPMYKKEQMGRQPLPQPPAATGLPGVVQAMQQEAERAALPKYNTQLMPVEEAAFWPWKAQNAPNDSGETVDLRGAFKAGQKKDKLGNWPEQYRKPNHPQFTINSIYAKDAPEKAGHINGNVYVPPAKKEDPNKIPGMEKLDRRGHLPGEGWAAPPSEDTMRTTVERMEAANPPIFRPATPTLTEPENPPWKRFEDQPVRRMLGSTAAAVKNAPAEIISSIGSLGEAGLSEVPFARDNAWAAGAPARELQMRQQQEGSWVDPSLSPFHPENLLHEGAKQVGQTAVFGPMGWGSGAMGAGAAGRAGLNKLLAKGLTKVGVGEAAAAKFVPAAIKAGVGATVSAAGETFMDAGSAYQTALNEGHEPEVARQLAYLTTKLELPATAFVNIAQMFVPGMKGIKARLAGFGTEGGQEVIQGEMQRLAREMLKMPNLDVNTQRALELILGGGAGFIVGGGASDVHHAGPPQAQPINQPKIIPQGAPSVEENRQGNVPSQVGVGQESEQAGTQQGASGEETQAGRVLRPEEEVKALEDRLTAAETALGVEEAAPGPPVEQHPNYQEFAARFGPEKARWLLDPNTDEYESAEELARLMAETPAPVQTPPPPTTPEAATQVEQGPAPATPAQPVVAPAPVVEETTPEPTPEPVPEPEPTPEPEAEPEKPFKLEYGGDSTAQDLQNHPKFLGVDANGMAYYQGPAETGGGIYWRRADQPGFFAADHGYPNDMRPAGTQSWWEASGHKAIVQPGPAFEASKPAAKPTVPAAQKPVAAVPDWLTSGPAPTFAALKQTFGNDAARVLDLRRSTKPAAKAELAALVSKLSPEQLAELQQNIAAPAATPAVVPVQQQETKPSKVEEPDEADKFIAEAEARKEKKGKQARVPAGQHKAPALTEDEQTRLDALKKEAQQPTKRHAVQPIKPPVQQAPTRTPVRPPLPGQKAAETEEEDAPRRKTPAEVQESLRRMDEEGRGTPGRVRPPSERPATDAQWDYVKRLWNEGWAHGWKKLPNIDVHHRPYNYSVAQASEDIENLKAGKASKWKNEQTAAAPAPVVEEEAPKTSAEVLGEKLGRQYDELIDADYSPSNQRAIDAMEAAMTPEQRKALHVPEKESYHAPEVPRDEVRQEREDAETAEEEMDEPSLMAGAAIPSVEDGLDYSSPYDLGDSLVKHAKDLRRNSFLPLTTKQNRAKAAFAKAREGMKKRGWSQTEIDAAAKAVFDGLGDELAGSTHAASRWGKIIQESMGSEAPLSYERREGPLKTGERVKGAPPAAGRVPRNASGAKAAIPAGNLPRLAKFRDIVNAAWLRTYKRKGGDASGRVWVNSPGRRLIGSLLGIDNPNWDGLNLSLPEIREMRTELERRNLDSPTYNKASDFLDAIENTINESKGGTASLIFPAVPGETNQPSAAPRKLSKLRRVNAHEQQHGTQARLGKLNPNYNLATAPEGSDALRHAAAFAWDHSWWRGLPYAKTIQEKLKAANYAHENNTQVSTEIASALADGLFEERLGLNAEQAAEVAQHLLDAVEAQHGENALAVLRGWHVDTLSRMYEDRPGLKERHEAYEAKGGIERAEQAKAEGKKSDRGEKLPPHRYVPASRMRQSAASQGESRFAGAAVEENEKPESLAKESQTMDTSWGENWEKSKENFYDSFPKEQQEPIREFMKKYEKENPRGKVSFEKAREEMMKFAERLGKDVKDGVDLSHYQKEGLAAIYMGMAARKRMGEINLERYEMEKQLGQMISEKKVSEEEINKHQEKLDELVAEEKVLADYGLKMRTQAGRDLVYYRLSMQNEPFDVSAILAKARRALKVKPKNALDPNLEKDLKNIAAEGKKAYDKATDEQFKKRDARRKELWKKAEEEARKKGEGKAPTSLERIAEEKARILREVQREMDKFDKNWSKNPKDPSKWKLSAEEKQAAEQDPEVIEARRKLAERLAKEHKLGIAATLSKFYKMSLLMGTGHITGLLAEQIRKTVTGSKEGPKEGSAWEKIHAGLGALGSGSAVANAIGNSLNQVTEELDRPASWIIDKLLRNTFFKNIIHRQQIGAPSLGRIGRSFWHGLVKQGGPALMQVYRRGATDEAMARWDMPRGVETKSKNWLLQAMAHSSDYVARGLGGMDAAFNKMGQYGAREEYSKMKGWENDIEGINKVAEEAGKRLTLNDDTIAGKLSESLRHFLTRGQGHLGLPELRHVGQGLSLFADVILPYVNTPSNITHSAISHSPVGFVYRPLRTLAKARQEIPVSKYREERGLAEDAPLRAEDIKNEMIRRGMSEEVYRDMVRGLGAATTGSVLWYYLGGYLLSKLGILTGPYDDEDRDKQNVRTAAGKKPLTLEIGGRQWRMDQSPVAQTMAAGAHMERVQRENPSVAQALKGVVPSVMTALDANPVFTSGSDIIKSINEADRYGTKAAFQSFAAKKAAGFIPAGIGTIAQALDPMQRDTRNREHDLPGAMNVIKNKVPLMRQGYVPFVKGLQEKVNVLGEKEKTGGMDSFSPIGGTPFKGEETLPDQKRATGYRVLEEMDIGMPYLKQKKNESDEDYAERAKERGDDVLEAVADLAMSAVYKAMSRQEKREALMEIANPAELKRMAKEAAEKEAAEEEAAVKP